MAADFGICGGGTRRWDSDPTRTCQAPALDSVGGPCLAHHPDRFRLVEEQAARRDVRLDNAEIDPDLASHLALLLEATDPKTDFHASGATFIRDALFKGARFGEVAIFEGASFRGDARFERATFTGTAWFDGAEFTRQAWFSETTFGDDDAVVPDTSFVGARFGGDARFEGATFTGDARFKGAEFTGEAWFQVKKFTGGEARFDEAKFKADAIFEGATFEGAAMFSGAKFSGDALFEGNMGKPTGRPFALGATFMCRATFDKATFSGRAGFSSMCFRKAASFKRATFTGTAGFDEATFSADASFEGATFSGTAGFDEATFSADASFEGATFSGTAGFDEATFSADASFEGATFGGDASFSEATFHREIRLASSCLGPILLLGERGDGQINADLSNIRVADTTTVELAGPWRLIADHLVLRAPLTIMAKSEPGSSQPFTDRRPSVASMRETTLLAPLTLGDGIALTDVSFLGTTGLDQLRLRGDPRWYPYRRRASLWDEQAARGHTGSSSRAATTPEPEGAGQQAGRPSYAQVEVLYRQLRSALEQSKAAPDAADFYYGEMEMRRLRAGKVDPKHRAEASLLLIYRFIGGYGVRAWRPLAGYLFLLAATVIALLKEPSRSHLVTAKVVDNLDITAPSGAIGFVLRNSTSIFSPPVTALTGLGTSLFVFERYAALSLLTLFVLAVRSKVQR